MNKYCMVYRLCFLGYGVLTEELLKKNVTVYSWKSDRVFSPAIQVTNNVMLAIMWCIMLRHLCNHLYIILLLLWLSKIRTCV